ncbi:MAG: hypothetical protein BGO20_21110 [Bosea sp. 67-29]|nr:MAG: hypothetical protein BGO20_21110 [Bosea sp. 67-29]
MALAIRRCLRLCDIDRSGAVMLFPGEASAIGRGRASLLMHHVYVADFLLSTIDLPCETDKGRRR